MMVKNTTNNYKDRQFVFILKEKNKRIVSKLLLAKIVGGILNFTNNQNRLHLQIMMS